MSKPFLVQYAYFFFFLKSFNLFFKIRALTTTLDSQEEVWFLDCLFKRFLFSAEDF